MTPYRGGTSNDENDESVHLFSPTQLLDASDDSSVTLLHSIFSPKFHAQSAKKKKKRSNSSLHHQDEQQHQVMQEHGVHRGGRGGEAINHHHSIFSPVSTGSTTIGGRIDVDDANDNSMAMSEMSDEFSTIHAILRGETVDSIKKLVGLDRANHPLFQSKSEGNDAVGMGTSNSNVTSTTAMGHCEYDVESKYDGTDQIVNDNANQFQDLHDDNNPSIADDSTEVMLDKARLLSNNTRNQDKVPTSTYHHDQNINFTSPPGNHQQQSIATSRYATKTPKVTPPTSDDEFYTPSTSDKPDREQYYDMIPRLSSSVPCPMALTFDVAVGTSEGVKRGLTPVWEEEDEGKAEEEDDIQSSKVDWDDVLEHIQSLEMDNSSVDMKEFRTPKQQGMDRQMNDYDTDGYDDDDDEDDINESTHVHHHHHHYDDIGEIEAGFDDNDTENNISIYETHTVKKRRGGLVAVPSEVSLHGRHHHLDGGEDDDSVTSYSDDDDDDIQKGSESEEEESLSVCSDDDDDQINASDEEDEVANDDEDDESVSDYESEDDYNEFDDEALNATASDQESILGDDTSSCGSAPSLRSSSCSSSTSSGGDSRNSLPRQWKKHSSQQQPPPPPHELFLPWGMPTSMEELKYDEDDESSSDEEDDDDDDYPQQQRHRTYMMLGNRSISRPRMWHGCSVVPPSNTRHSKSLTSSNRSHRSNNNNSEDESSPSSSSPPSRGGGVTFHNSVTVYPIFETTHYPPTMIQNMYTKRDELRVNKLRNKREFAHEMYDWRNAVEEDEMEVDASTGELIHPAHEKKTASSPASSSSSTSSSMTTTTTSSTTTTTHRQVVQTYSSAFGGYTIGGMTCGSSALVHQQHNKQHQQQQPRVKRMRMYYP